MIYAYSSRRHMDFDGVRQTSETGMICVGEVVSIISEEPINIGAIFVSGALNHSKPPA